MSDRLYGVLMAWRAAERELAGILEDSPEWPRIQANVANFRASYHLLFNERREAWSEAHGLPAGR